MSYRTLAYAALVEACESLEGQLAATVDQRDAAELERDRLTAMLMEADRRVGLPVDLRKTAEIERDHAEALD